MAKTTEFGAALFMCLLVLGAAWWVGTILQASGEDKLVRACAPVEITTDALHYVAGALVGSSPRWTLEVQSYLMSTCYYGFASFLLSPDSPQIPLGGLRN